MAIRHGDGAAVDVIRRRGELIASQADGFWFQTREGVDFGPYLSREQALLGRRVFTYQVTGDPRLKPRLPEHQQYLLDDHEGENSG